MIVKMRPELVLQQDAMYCGPSCLAMIVGHYGLHPNNYWFDGKPLLVWYANQ